MSTAPRGSCNRKRTSSQVLSACLLLLCCPPLASAASRELVLGKIKVNSGASERIDTPVWFRCRWSEVLGARKALPENQQLLLREVGRRSPPIPVQWLPEPAFPWEKARDEGVLAWILPGRTSRGVTRTFTLVLKEEPPLPPDFLVEDIDRTQLLVRRGARRVLRYNYGVIAEVKGRTGPYDRAAYIHPVWTPGGKVITGDFSPEHIHQRGIYLAPRKVNFGEVETDFWGLGSSTGRMLPDGRAPVIRNGPVVTEILIHNQGRVAGQIRLREVLSIRIWAHPAGHTWLFDVRTRQAPLDPARPDEAPGQSVTMVWAKVYYGGMAFRGTAEWLSRASKDVARALERGVEFPGYKWLPPDVSLDVLTSEGKDRVGGDRTAARWIDYTGPLNGDWGGVVMFDHPSNLRYPTPLRIHPELPYFCYALAHNEPVVIRGDQPLDLCYRILVHSGRPNRDLNEGFARDFAHPPQVIWER